LKKTWETKKSRRMFKKTNLTHGLLISDTPMQFLYPRESRREGEKGGNIGGLHGIASMLTVGGVKPTAKDNRKKTKMIGSRETKRRKKYFVSDAGK